MLTFLIDNSLEVHSATDVILMAKNHYLVCRDSIRGVKDQCFDSHRLISLVVGVDHFNTLADRHLVSAQGMISRWIEDQ